MADKGNSEKIGYGKPPKRTQFVKGKSGNPRGRPKGSQNLATILQKIIRQRVSVTENGRTREISKAEAILVQLVNSALRGDIHATHELRHWTQMLDEYTKAAASSPILNDNDKAVIAGIIERFKRTADAASNIDKVPAIPGSSGEKS
jgi:hypothetical protein